MGRIIGIDLGTTTSEIAYINNGKPEIIVDVNNNRIIPSAVHLNDDGEIIIGDYAKRMKLVKPERTVMEIKRKMGQNVSVKLENDYYKPYEISSMILKKLKEYAELYLGEEVTEAVITVPANFNDLQRNATKRAGELAGLKVERIINEPTAAALAYGINNLDDVGKVLVYDLGGGTFDVSVLDFDSGILDVLASRGINCLGGKDFDNLIADYILNDFYNKYGINLKNDLKCMSRITEAAENAKIELSSVLSTEIFLPFLAIDSNQKPIDYSLKLTRSEFENMIYDLLNSTIYKVSEALEAAKLNDKDIDIVLAVGGSSRIPLVKNLLVKRFGNKIKTKINPDEAVALGAAIQAGIKNDEISPEDGIIITDACYYNLGIKVATEVGNGRIVEGIFDCLIKKDSKIPCTEKKIYTTIVDYQTEVIIDVYQGDEIFVKDNTKIREFLLEGIPPALKGEQQIEITFSYSLNEILEVTAKILSTGKEITTIINILEDSDSIRGIDLEQWRECPLAEKVEKIIDFCEKRINNMKGNDKQNVTITLNKLKEAVINNNEELVDKYDVELTDILFEID